METTLKHRYWGMFAEIRARKDLHVEEMESTYEGPFAVLADRSFGEITDVDGYLELAEQQGGPCWNWDAVRAASCSGWRSADWM